MKIKSSNLLLGCFAGLVICAGIALVINESYKPAPKLLPKRADITDCNGEVLATSNANITMLTRGIKDREKAARLIHNVFPQNYSMEDAINLVNSPDIKFKYIKKDATEEQINAVYHAKVDGIEIELLTPRYYPKGGIFAQILGSWEPLSDKKQGVEFVYKDHLNIDGQLKLSLDSRLQSVFHEQLYSALNKYSAKAAMGILMNSQTGEIVAMVSVPDEDTFLPVNGLYEIGSQSVIFTTALALENGITQEYYIAEPFEILTPFGKVVATVRDVKSFKPKKPYMNAEEIMQYSSNVGAAQVALSLSKRSMKKMFRDLHLDEPLFVDMGTTEKPLLPRKWGTLERATIAFGHGTMVSPVQMLAAFNTFATGEYKNPTLIAGNVSEGERVFSEATAQRIRGILKQITNQASGKNPHNLAINAYSVEKRTSDGEVVAGANFTFVTGFLPADEPRYTFLILLDEPLGTKEAFGFRTAAWNVAPTTGKLLDIIMPILMNEKEGQYEKN